MYKNIFLNRLSFKSHSVSAHTGAGSLEQKPWTINRKVLLLTLIASMVSSSPAIAGQDGDGIPDDIDLDSDNDGIPDSEEISGGVPVFFTSSGTTMSSNVNSYSTSSAEIGTFTLNSANSFMLLGGNPTAQQPTSLVSYPNALHFLEGSAAAFNPPGYATENFTIDDAYPDFAGNQVLFTSSNVVGNFTSTSTDPDSGISYTANIDSPQILNFEGDEINLEFSTEFIVDDVANYGDFFLEHREYADAGFIEIYVNGSHHRVTSHIHSRLTRPLPTRNIQSRRWGFKTRVGNLIRRFLMRDWRFNDVQPRSHIRQSLL